MNLIIVLPIIIVMIALRFTKLNIAGWLVVWWISSYIIFSYAILPPLPNSIIFMFMGILTIALVTYLSIRTEDLNLLRGGVVRFITDKKYSAGLIFVVVLLPMLVAFKVYVDTSKKPQPPISSRTIHPPPPREIQVKGKNIDLVNGTNPFRELEKSDPEAFAVHVENGRRIYYQNCVFCHGDNMEGNGNFAHGFDPIPANFKDPTTIAMLQESYLFWRIAKGAPGLPNESTPWASAMPAWENFLTEDEIWDVIIFLYEFTGYKPREQVVHQ